jgi:hypothetical protein
VPGLTRLSHPLTVWTRLSHPLPVWTDKTLVSSTCLDKTLASSKLTVWTRYRLTIFSTATASCTLYMRKNVYEAETLLYTYTAEL